MDHPPCKTSNYYFYNTNLWLLVFRGPSLVDNPCKMLTKDLSELGKALLDRFVHYYYYYYFDNSNSSGPYNRLVLEMIGPTQKIDHQINSENTIEFWYMDDSVVRVLLMYKCTTWELNLCCMGCIVSSLPVPVGGWRNVHYFLVILIKVVRMTIN